MNEALRYTKGLGDATVYARIPYAGKFWNFATLLWSNIEVAACRVFMTEMAEDTSVDSSWYYATLTPPNGGPWPVEIVRVDTGDVIGNDIAVVLPMEPTGTISFSDYIALRPEATPITGADKLLVTQDGEVKLTGSTTVGGGIVETVLIDASTTPVTALPLSGEIVYVKSDDTADVAGFSISVLGHTMCQELQNGLANTGESIRVKLIGVHWYKID